MAPSPSLTSCRQEIMNLYAAGALPKALELARRYEVEVPGYRDEAIYLESCLLCQMARPEEGMKALRSLVQGGGWYSWEHMSGDPDLKPIQDCQEFKDLGPVFEARRRTAAESAQPVVLSSLPTDPTSDATRPPLLVIHGRAGNAVESLERWRSAADEGHAVFCLQSSQPYSPGFFQWDDESRSGKDLRAGVEAIARALPRGHAPPILAGYSQGALFALRSLLSSAVPGARSAVLVCPSTRLGSDKGEETLAAVRASPRRGLAVHILSGEHDFSLNFQRQLQTVLTEAEARCELEVVAGGGHDYPPAFAEHLARALASLGTDR